MKYVKIEGGRKLDSFIEPMTAKASDQGAFDSNDWVFEIKWDGYRAVAEIKKGKKSLYSRNGLSFDKQYPKLFEALEKKGNEVSIIHYNHFGELTRDMSGSEFVIVRSYRKLELKK